MKMLETDVLRCFSESDDIIVSVQSLGNLFVTHAVSMAEIQSILCGSLVRSHFGVECYWLLHVSGIMSFKYFLAASNPKELAKGLCQLIASPDKPRIRIFQNTRSGEMLHPKNTLDGVMHMFYLGHIILNYRE